MTRVFKLGKSAAKKGFTLLEVILSVAIMLILTTMMMNGFAATMSYSYHTSVYASTAATNYSNALSKLAEKSSVSFEAYKDMGKASAEKKTLSIARTNSAYNNPSAYKTMNVEVYRENGGAEAARTHGYRSQVENYGESKDGTYANNRSSFYYYPNYITESTTDADRGTLRVYKYSDVYWWCRKKVNSTTGAVTIEKVKQVNAKTTTESSTESSTSGET